MESEMLEKIRRNLLASSVLLTFFYLTAAAIEPTQTGGVLLGLRLGRPDVAIWFLWVAHGYFLVRFWVHCRAQNLGWRENSARSYMGSAAGKALLAKHGGIQSGNVQYPRMTRPLLIGRRLEFHRADTGDAVHEVKVRYRDVCIDELVADFRRLGNYQAIDVLVPNLAAIAPVVAFVVHRCGLL